MDFDWETISPEAWAGAYQSVLDRLTDPQREMLAISSSVPSVEDFVSKAPAGPEVWKREGGDPTMQALWGLAARALVPGPLPTLQVRDTKWTTLKVLAATVVFEQPMTLVAPVVILGDVRTSWPLRDCGPDSCVTVVGSLRTPGLMTTGEFQVGGDLDATLVQGVYNDNVLLVLGATRARLVYEGDHDCRFAGPCEIGVHASLGDLRAEQHRKLAAALRPEFLAGERVDLSAAMDAWAGGADIFLRP